MAENLVRAIAFYLPQYHPIPENDEWWGKGFTEWTNVTKAKPLFRGHYQPHLPADLGFYDLRLSESRIAQAELARAHGIHGFCYYHYWFNGRRILERPFSEVLASGNPNFPFCLCWANENWTRAWDGQDREVLLQQVYGELDDRAHLQAIAPAFADPRYIRVGGKPLFIVYRASSLPDALRTTDTWRDEAIRLGLGELYLCRVENFDTDHSNPKAMGFDAAIEFAPDWGCVGTLLGRSRWDYRLARVDKNRRFSLANRLCDYDTLTANMLAKHKTDYLRYRCVTPMWDNTARRRVDSTAFVGSTPEKYGKWLSSIAKVAVQDNSDPIVFINAWNEWAEGNHLEPCQLYGHRYLEATRDALIWPRPYQA